MEIAICIKNWQNIDPISAKKINPNDRHRMIRALEIFHVTGKTYVIILIKIFRRETDKY